MFQPLICPAEYCWVTAVAQFALHLYLFTVKWVHSNESHLANKWLIYLASIKLSLIVVFTTQLSIWRNQTRGLFFPWIDDQKRRSLAFRRDTFLENLAIPLRCSYCPRMGQNGLCRTIAMTSSASTSIYEEYWENRTAIRAAERWRLYKHPISLTPWKSTKNVATPQFLSPKTPIKWSLTRRSILNKPDDLPKTFCIVTSRREIRGEKMQRACVKGSRM